MADWGRKEYKKAWPSRRPVWGIGAFFAATLVFAGMMTIQYERSWTAADGLYWKDYLKSGVRGQTSARSVSKYTLLEGMTAKGQGLFLKGDQVEAVTDPDGQQAGKQGWRLTEAGAKLGIAKLQWVTGTFNDRALHRLLGSVVYADVEGWEFYRVPVYTALAFFVLMLFVAVPRDRKRRMVWKHGRRLRGPELVTTSELNEKLGKSKLLKTILPDGVMFINEEQTWWDKIAHKDLSRWARIPRDREAMHFLIVGDSGTGKSAAIRQLLSQIWERGEAAIVYDPAMEYLPQFYNAARGDVILNPMDARCPFWSPGDEVPHEAEALTLAASLFPDQGRENRFFVEAPRKIFAHLLNLKPTPQELTYWMSNADDQDNKLGFDPATDVDDLREAVNQIGGVKLLIIDPIVSAVTGDMHKANDVRRSLQPIVDFAAEMNCAVVGITHFAKNTGGRNTTERVIGSQAFAALARMVLATAKEEDSELRVFTRAKSNISSDNGGFHYTIEQVPIRTNTGAVLLTTRIVWGAVVEGTARSILSTVEGDDAPQYGKKMDEARTFLYNTLSKGPVPATQVQTLARLAGISSVTLQRAKEAMNIQSSKNKGNLTGGWDWCLPEQRLLP